LTAPLFGGTIRAMDILLLIAAFLMFLSPFLAVGLALFLTRRYVEGRVQAVLDVATSELEALSKGEACQSGAVLNAIGQLVGSEAGRSAKAALMADLAHGKRNLNAAEAEAQADALTEGAPPGIGALLAGMSGRRKSKLLGNPLVQLALAGLGRGGNQGNHSSGPSRPGPKSFSL